MLTKKWVLIGILSLGLSAAAPVGFARDGGACKSDIEKFCKDTEGGKGRIYGCLKEHKAELSPACQAKMERKEQRRSACRADVEKFCKDVPRGTGEFKTCMKEHRSQFSPECKAAFESKKKRS